ncbi:Hypothetical_protein [Hexamita inflata]|uniref:Hypothetical_protein n=1 Tax=Hexamita inflata TaxID=28002 RepID=A0AA86P4J4_9EUKA|nr:Hypothetical protein HINF_LOCUS17752 [Hexamita inflata]
MSIPTKQIKVQRAFNVCFYAKKVRNPQRALEIKRWVALHAINSKQQRDGLHMYRYRLNFRLKCICTVLHRNGNSLEKSLELSLTVIYQSGFTAKFQELAERQQLFGYLVFNGALFGERNASPQSYTRNHNRLTTTLLDWTLSLQLNYMSFDASLSNALFGPVIE